MVFLTFFWLFLLCICGNTLGSITFALYSSKVSFLLCWHGYRENRWASYFMVMKRLLEGLCLWETDISGYFASPVNAFSFTLQYVFWPLLLTSLRVDPEIHQVARDGEGVSESTRHMQILNKYNVTFGKRIDLLLSGDNNDISSIWKERINLSTKQEYEN